MSEIFEKKRDIVEYDSFTRIGEVLKNCWRCSGGSDF
jgi:hypothetical protein